MEAEVRVHRVRRRRSEPPISETPKPPNVRNWLIYTGLTTVVAALMFEGHLSHKARDPLLPPRAEATEVRSIISPTADSLQVVVSWDLTLSNPEGQPDSVAIKVISASGDTLTARQLATVFADTVYLRQGPLSGQPLRGSSCVMAKHLEEPLTEICTPWQYVRPVVTAGASTMAPQKIVLRPSGLQVDPDVGGKCAEWQRLHPGESVWVTVNRAARRECTGANGKPTVAQFCAFTILPEGRRAKAANSADSSYCEELFEEWVRETYSVEATTRLVPVTSR